MSEGTLTRADLVEALYALRLQNRSKEPPEPLSREECAILVESVLREIADALVRGESVKISSFGSFTVRQKNERVGRNPRTGVEARITSRRVPLFRASMVMKERLNGSDSDADDLDDETVDA
ncbi:MAG: integration host factor subunit alpha [Neomegalonema sp.]|nr:integration host factor subunit alpha [Neomegalonema sp.]